MAGFSPEKYSPLDKTRELNNIVKEYDFRFEELTGESPKKAADIAKDLESYSLESPLLGQEVIVYGHKLVPYRESDMGVGSLGCLAVDSSSDSTSSKTTGIYRGFTAVHAYNTEFDSMAWRVVHCVETGRESFANPFFFKFDVTYHQLVCALGSEVVPLLPLNAHSLKDLADDPVARKIDEITSTNSDDRFGKVKRIGNFLNETLKETVPDDEPNPQRISYLNSKHLVDGASILAKDYVIIKTDAKKAERIIDFSQTDKLSEMEGKLFLLGDGYERFKTETVFRPSTELYVEASASDCKRIIVPVKNIVSVH